MHSHDNYDRGSEAQRPNREAGLTLTKSIQILFQSRERVDMEASGRVAEYLVFLRKNVLGLMSVLALGFGCVMFWKHAQQGLRLFEFNDETEQFIVGKLLTHGQRLYKDVFSHHGPLPYLITHVYAMAVSYSDFSFIRVFQIVLAAASCLAIVFSRALKTRAVRLWAGAIYLLTLATVWNLEELNALTYYAMSGLFIVVFIAQFVLPVMIGEIPTRFGMLVSGAAASLALCCAYSNGPGVVLLCLAAVPGLVALVKRTDFLYVGAWFLAGAVAVGGTVIGWMLKFGDLRGYFIYHIYFNQDVYTKYVPFSYADVLNNISFSFRPESIVHALAISLMACWIFTQIFNIGRAISRRKLWGKLASLLVLILGVLFTNPRGFDTLFDVGFVTANIALFSLSAAGALELAMESRSIPRVIQAIAVPLGAIVLAHKVGAYGVTFWNVPQEDFPKYVGTMQPSSEPIYKFVRSITSDYGDLLVLNYGAQIYLKADRLPASGNMFYLPWQADYNRTPIDGYHLNICADIARRPAVIWLLNRRVPGSTAIDEYEPCALSLITRNYTELNFGSPWYVRTDIFNRIKDGVPKNVPAELNLEPNTGKILYTSAELSPFAPIRLLVDPHHVERHLSLRRIGILFSTNGRRNSSSAELYLEGPKRSSISRIFEVSTLRDNSYRFFDLDSNEYTSGEIRAAEGGGISAWESHLVQGFEADSPESYTCIIYEYTDGSRRYTPACPVM